MRNTVLRIQKSISLDTNFGLASHIVDNNTKLTPCDCHHEFFNCLKKCSTAGITAHFRTDRPATTDRDIKIKNTRNDPEND